MTITWRYVQRAFFQNFFFFFLCLNFLAFSTKFTHVIEFIASGATLKQVLLLLITFLPYFFPFVLGACCLMSAFFTALKLRQTGELTAMRISGLSIKLIFAPLLCWGFVLSLANFFIVSELIPISRYHTNNVLLGNTVINPLTLIKRQSISPLKDAYIRMDLDSKGKKAGHLLLIKKHPRTGRLALFQAKDITLTENCDLSFSSQLLLTSFPSSSYDHLAFDFAEEATIPGKLLMDAFEKKTTVNKRDITPLKHLFQSDVFRDLLEVFSRVTKSIFPFTLTYAGLIFGCFYGDRKKRGSLALAALTLLYFSSYFFAKNFAKTTETAAILLFGPLLLLLAISFFLQCKLERRPV